jgi:hypothetical protein
MHRLPVEGMRARRVWIGLGIIAALSLGAASACPLAAQTVQGRVLESESRVPVYTADVNLLGLGDTVVVRSITDSEGGFVLRAPGPGWYRLRAARIGYVPFESDSFRLDTEQEAVAEVSLEVNPVALEPLEATVERPRPQKLVLEGFYRRQERGFGQFMTPEQLHEMKLHFPRDLFWGMSGIRLRDNRYGGLTIHKSLGSGCRLSVTVDGQVVQGGGNYEIGGGPWTDVVHVSEIEAVEVYSSAAGVPAWATRYSPCGAVIIWTR